VQREIEVMVRPTPRNSRIFASRIRRLSDDPFTKPYAKNELAVFLNAALDLSESCKGSGESFARE
jgi:hypothetical protein